MALPNRDNSTAYQHPQETNLLNVHKAMQYNTDGEPELRVTNSLTLTSAPWNLQVARGLVTGVTGLSISGYNSAVDSTFRPLWHYGDRSYVYFSVAQQVRVWSASASDTNVSVLVSGLDANYLPITETVIVNDGTGTLTTKSFLRVNNLAVTRLPMNLGLITAGSSDKTIELAHIGTVSNDSVGRSQMTVYTVPAGYTFYLTQSQWYTNNTGNQTSLYRSYTVSSTGVINTILTFPFPTTYNSVKVVPRPYPEKTDIQWQVAASTGTTRIGGQIEGYLIQNGV